MLNPEINTVQLKLHLNNDMEGNMSEENAEKLLTELEDTLDHQHISRKRLLDELFDYYPKYEEFIRTPVMEINERLSRYLIIPREESYIEPAFVNPSELSLIMGVAKDNCKMQYIDHCITGKEYSAVKAILEEYKDVTDLRFVYEMFSSYEAAIKERIDSLKFEDTIGLVMKEAASKINKDIIAQLMFERLSTNDEETAELCEKLFPALGRYFRALGFYTIMPPVIGEKFNEENDRERYYSLIQVYNSSRSLVGYIVEILSLSYGSVYSYKTSDYDCLSDGKVIEGSVGIYTTNNS